MERFEDTVAVVTGGGSGIGRGIALALARAGSTVVVADIDPARVVAVATELQSIGVGPTRPEAMGVACDVTDRAAVEQLADVAWDRYGHVDLVANNAGVFPHFSSILDLEEDDARWVLDVNLMGVWYGCGVFGKRFVEQGTPAHILNTGSENSVGVPHTHAAIYTASKHAVLGLSDVLRRELPDFVGVSVLCRGDGGDRPGHGWSSPSHALRRPRSDEPLAAARRRDGSRGGGRARGRRRSAGRLRDHDPPLGTRDHGAAGPGRRRRVRGAGRSGREVNER